MEIHTGTDENKKICENKKIIFIPGPVCHFCAEKCIGNFHAYLLFFLL